MTEEPNLKHIELLAKGLQEGKDISEITEDTEFDGVDDRKAALISILLLAEKYCDFLVNMTGQQEYDDCKSQQMCGAVASAYETVSYSDNSIRIREVIQSINRMQIMQQTYFYERYQELDER